VTGGGGVGSNPVSSAMHLITEFKWLPCRMNRQATIFGPDNAAAEATTPDGPAMKRERIV